MANIVDIEEYAKEGKEVPTHGVQYRFKVGNKLLIWSEPTITGKQILELAQLIPVTQYQLNQKFKHGVVEPIELTEVVELTRKGLERFTYMKLDQTEGSK